MDKYCFPCFQLSLITSCKIDQRQVSIQSGHPMSFQHGIKKISGALFSYSKVKLSLTWITKRIWHSGIQEKKKYSNTKWIQGNKDIDVSFDLVTWKSWNNNFRGEWRWRPDHWKVNEKLRSRDWKCKQSLGRLCFLLLLFACWSS